jgi:hypothetical protein
MDDPQPEERTSFKYEVLPDISRIRLARIHPSVPGQPLEVILISAPITSATQMNYLALSYCWGDQTEKVPIICNGNNFEITSNLHEALARIQNDPDYGPSHIWADALCIN